MSHQSMTGFGKGEALGEKYKVTTEIKSVNHRFKDTRFKMSSYFNSIELDLKKVLESHFKRGSFEIFLQYKKNPDLASSVELDEKKIATYLEQVKGIADAKGVNLSVSPTEFLRSDFYTDDEDKVDELKEQAVASFEAACKELVKSRLDEGQKLINTLSDHAQKYREHYEEVVKLKDSYQDGIKEKLIARLEKEDIKFDEQRLQQEVIYYLEKLDIEEEISRIQIHLEKLKKVLETSGECGRQIDFLVQELNRETNTIGSKCASDKISENVIQMKVHLEKIREQALNME
tara:strand:+ start:42968 stop:43834 length:867 start_codon:yes stop_codon:yes gene_type:complete